MGQTLGVLFLEGLFLPRSKSYIENRYCASCNFIFHFLQIFQHHHAPIALNFILTFRCGRQKITKKTSTRLVSKTCPVLRFHFNVNHVMMTPESDTRIVFCAMHKHQTVTASL